MLKDIDQFEDKYNHAKKFVEAQALEGSKAGAVAA